MNELLRECYPCRATSSFMWITQISRCSILGDYDAKDVRWIYRRRKNHSEQTKAAAHNTGGAFKSYLSLNQYYRNKNWKLNKTVSKYKRNPSTSKLESYYLYETIFLSRVT